MDEDSNRKDNCNTITVQVTDIEVSTIVTANKETDTTTTIVGNRWGTTIKTTTILVTKNDTKR